MTMTVVLTILEAERLSFFIGSVMQTRKYFILLIVLLLSVGCSINSDPNQQLVATKISDLMLNQVNRSNAYNGLVVAQQTKEINKDENKVVKDILVKEGDEVKVDTVLFTYDVEAMQVEVSKVAIDIERMNNEILNSQAQINNLIAERNNAPASQKFSYTIEIQSLEATIAETNYNIKAKQVEQQHLNASIENANVLAEIEGIVQSINENNSFDPMGNPAAFITILQTGNYRVKGTVNELNITQITPSTPVIIRSRMDDQQTWSGIIDVVETNSPDQNPNPGGMPRDEMANSSNYPFYVVMDNTDGLFLGQHVYIELDSGQSVPKEGVWIPNDYVVFSEEGVAQVYKANASSTLELVDVVIGMMDESTNQIEILEGLTLEDYIIAPNDEVKVGVKVTLKESQ